MTARYLDPLFGDRKPLFYEIWQSTGYRCWYCGHQPIYEEQTEDGSALYFDEWDCHIDHVHPRSKGGSNARSNLVPACRDCNLSKHSLSVEEYRVRVKKKLNELLPPEFRSDDAIVFAFEEEGWTYGMD